MDWIRSLLLPLGCILSLLTTVTAEEPAETELSSEPYTVFVAADDVYARCGPSEEFYRTDPLRTGQSLEVYAETPDGWLGVRPPEESFCWVVADAVEMETGSEFGTVIEDRTVAWIGTQLGRARKFRWQVQLAKGEPVTVIGRSEREGPDGPQLWYRIVPPSGEFRWVHRDQVVKNPEALVRQVKAESQRQMLARNQSLESDDRPILEGDPSTRSAVDQQDPRIARTLDTAVQPRSQRRFPRPANNTILGPENQSAGGDLVPVIGSGLRDDFSSTAQVAAQSETADGNPFIALDDRTAEPSGTPLRPADPGDVTNTLRDVNASLDNASHALATGQGQPSQPNGDSQAGPMQAGDGNWVSAGLPGSQSNAAPGELPSGVQQVSNQEPLPATQLQRQTVTPAMASMNVVSSTKIKQIELETRGADADRLSLLFSRLMAARATAVELEPVRLAARQVATTTNDPVGAGRARLLVERVEQYQRIARRRDGESVIRSETPPSIPNRSAPVTQANDEGRVTQAGYLVRVYSPRRNSPPFALTDHAGRTLVYVTPAPGVNVRQHLNSYVQVSGSQNFLRGLNIPHILADQTQRAASE